MVTTAGDAGACEGPTVEGGIVGHVAVDIDRSAVTADRQGQVGTGSGCRICQLEDGDLPAESGSGQLVNLGCGCRGEIAAAHRRCAEAWFSVRGNRRCEICGENAANITGWGGGGKEFMRQWHGMASVDGGGSSKARGLCTCRTQSFCNFLLACLIIVLISSWFFHNRMV
ncbi:hypothetical protein CFC21_010985 [Triticum aestivum]|uniref:RING-CH-type domain-containing protein n=3 Tax=Triticinae TaxID=1648030 RepID=A0A452Y6H1_AEGTS|nr:uncharacterized protein LOC109752787 [Aegilops tauschii subsp. strangulata]XP_044440644.1 uncharacterized protein LOC123166892 [Triticum aestivum]KAF6994230.1 hypothetical protein CFC21_010985 [Triticum aestivum]